MFRDKVFFSKFDKPKSKSMKTSLCYIIIFLLSYSASSAKAQSIKIVTYNTKTIDTADVNSTENALKVIECNKWSNKIKPYYRKLGNKLHTQSIKTTDSLLIVDYENIDKKMCLLIRKDTFVATDFRMPKSLEIIDSKMVYQKKSTSKP